MPLSVRAEQDRIRAHVERDPTTFFKDELPGVLRAMAAKVAARFGGRGEDWVFCENATSAVNGVLGSFPLAPGDEVLTTSHVYGAVLKTMREWARRRLASLMVAELPAISEGDAAVVEAIASAFSPRTRLLVVDHITSATATVFPVRQIAARARAAGIAVLVDGAHAPGQVPLDVPAIGADWYTGNAHKWLFAPRGCGLLWTAPSRQPQTLPAVLSHGAESGYAAAFDWVGTRDVSPWLAFEAGAQAFDLFGGNALIARNHLLAREGAALLCEGLETRCVAPPEMRGAMATILLKDWSENPEIAPALQKALARKYGIVAPVSFFGGSLKIRISAQAYNELDDYRRCLAAIRELRDGPFRGQSG
ncbi:MAG TPA: aminotransferase class V-fold PLP-dependent enzyme [Rhizomicrobium sp.]|nr:aminotransferase class V-fold PLP-dependent enzyme [Rhizomicrobium sp.]